MIFSPFFGVQITPKLQQLSSKHHDHDLGRLVGMMSEARGINGCMYMDMNLQIGDEAQVVDKCIYIHIYVYTYVHIYVYILYIYIYTYIYI